MKRILTILVILILNFSFAQQKFRELQKVTIDELKQEKSTLQSDAPAEILFRTIHYVVDERGNLNIEYIDRIKIYDKDRAKKYLNPEIQIYEFINGRGTQKLSSLNAVTYNLDNNNIITNKVEKNSKYQSKENKNIFVTKFTFEQVKNGSIVEYKYKIFADQIFLWMMPRFVIEADIPARYIDYFLDVPKYLGYNINYKGDLAPSIRKSEPMNIYGTDYNVFRFGYTDVPAFEEEDFVKNNDNYRTSIKAELNSTFINNELKNYSTSWNDIRKRLKDDEDFGLQLNKKHLVEDLLPAELKNITNKKDRADAILKFVQKNYKYNGEDQLYTDKGIKNLINTKIGNSAEINMLLIMLFREAHLMAYPVVLPTIDRGKILDYSPSITQLNYTFAAVQDGENYFYYDATDKSAGVFELPPKILNDRGILLADNEAVVLNIYFPDISTTYLTVDAKLNDDRTFSGSFKDRDTHIYARLVNKQYEDGATDFQKTYKDKYTFPFTDIKSGLQENGDFETSFNFTSDTFIDTVGDKLIFNPLLFLYTQKHAYNQTKERRSPIEFYSANERIKKVTITLPKGYVFENVPKSKKFRTEDNAIEYVYYVEQNGSQLIVETTTKIDNYMFPKEYYPAFKQIFDNITKLEGQVVTAVKK